MPGQVAFSFDETGSFQDNLAAFAAELRKIDVVLGPALSPALAELANAKREKAELLDQLLKEVSNADGAKATPTGPTSASTPSLTHPPVPVLSSTIRWFLEKLEIEGFRGINNENAPLVLKFKTDRISSISAPNGVGKSSIYDAISFALTGGIAKLDRLLQAERGQEYYVNRFHPAAVGSIKLSLKPDNGGKTVDVIVTASSVGARTVSGPAGVDAEALLAELNREFVLLDASTFQSFIETKALERGRMFSGLLGLDRYSGLHQELQALSNTRSFNTHFGVSIHSAEKASLTKKVQVAKSGISRDYENLVKEPLEPNVSAKDAQRRCHSAISGSPILVDHCVDQAFMDLNVDRCLEAVKEAEGGPKRVRYAELLRDQEKWFHADKQLPGEADLPLLADLANTREQALATTAGDLLNRLYRLSEKIMSDANWPSPSLCPTCERDDGNSVLDSVRLKMSQYDAVEAATSAVTTEWVTKGWGDLSELEKLTLRPGQAPRLNLLASVGQSGQITAEEARELAAYVLEMRGVAALARIDLAAERNELEKVLPASLVTVTKDVETARQLQIGWRELDKLEENLTYEAIRATQVERLKTFLDKACSRFATAESTMAAERLSKVEPLCRTLFEHIMFSPVVPALLKPSGSEEITIRLAEFWGLKNVSAQALLSESYRNAFAISVYLAAASLYGGPPRFMVLDDVTSSFDAGHQHHLIEVIRTSFARPLTPDGPQLILLSHDTHLEKLFNKHTGSAEWHHQRLEGTARTAVLPQTGAVNKVREATLDLLNAGRVEEATLRIRPYLEYTLHTVIDKCRIPVPMDLAFGDDKRTPGEYLTAIQTAVALHQKASDLVLEPAQVQKLGMHSATIIGNFLSHWSTGQTQAFSAPALLGVMKAIDEFPDCFKYAPASGEPVRFYKSLSKR